ncbi:hypothetical protein ACOMHN_060912 [Nucella lapillus]
MTTPHSKSPAGPGEPLCCCEYENAAGDRSHILACCCDCQALDEACDRVVTCRAVSPSTLHSLWSTLSDRCRLPWVSGRGAVRVRLDVVTPVLVVPCILLLASLGPRASVLAFLLMPTFLILFYQVWRRQGQGRTSFFFAWGLSSVVTCCVVFQSLVVSFREVLLWEGLLQASLTAAMLAMLYRTKVLLWEGLLQASLTAAMLAMLYRTKVGLLYCHHGSALLSPSPRGAAVGGASAGLTHRRHAGHALQDQGGSALLSPWVCFIVTLTARCCCGRGFCRPRSPPPCWPCSTGPRWVCFIVTMGLLYCHPHREVLLWEGLLQASLTAAMLAMLYRTKVCFIVTLTAAMLAMLYRTKSDPGILRSGERSRLGRSSAVSPLPTGATPLYDHATGRLVQEGRPLYDQSADTAVQLDTELNAADVSWVDSRPVRDGKLVSWCSSCSFKRPPRAGHCPVCDACIAVRDHHCVWIDHCIGAKNHRSFLATMVLFVWCGLYGCHLTFTSICTPVMVYDWFLLPNDCRFLYQNFYTSMSFVCGVYSLAACGLVAVAVLYQLVLISQNVTSQELHAALTRRPVTCGLCPSHNLHHQGVLRNWLDFLLLPARHASSKIPS